MDIVPIDCLHVNQRNEINEKSCALTLKKACKEQNIYYDNTSEFIDNRVTSSHNRSVTLSRHCEYPAVSAEKEEML